MHLHILTAEGFWSKGFFVSRKNNTGFFLGIVFFITAQTNNTNPQFNACEVLWDVSDIFSIVLFLTQTKVEADMF